MTKQLFVTKKVTSLEDSTADSGRLFYNTFVSHQASFIKLSMPITNFFMTNNIILIALAQ